VRVDDGGKMKKNNRISFWAGCLIVGGILLLAILISFLPGFYMRHFAKPEAYFEYVVERQAESSADLCAKLYGNLLAYLNMQDSGGAVEAGVRIDEDMLGLLSFLFSTDLTWLQNPNVSLTYSLHEERFGFEIGAFLGEGAVLGMEAAYDMEGKQAYMRVPELSEVWMTEVIETDVEALYELQAMAKQYPDVETFRERLFEAIMELMESAGDVEKGKSTLRVNGISQRCMTLTTQLDGELLGESSAVTLVLYVDGRHKVAGAELSAEDWSLYYAMPGKGTRYGMEISVNIGEEHYFVTGSGRLAGTNIKAEVELCYNDMECLHLKVDELNWMKMLSGSLYGRFEVRAREGMEDMLEAVFGTRILPVDVSGYGIQLLVEKERSRTKIEASLLGDEGQLVEVYVQYLAGKGTPVELPETEDCIFMQEEQATERWKATVDWDSYFAGLREIRIPEWIVEYLENAVISG